MSRTRLLVSWSQKRARGTSFAAGMWAAAQGGKPVQTLGSRVGHAISGATPPVPLLNKALSALDLSFFFLLAKA